MRKCTHMPTRATRVLFRGSPVHFPDPRNKCARSKGNFGQNFSVSFKSAQEFSKFDYRFCMGGLSFLGHEVHMYDLATKSLIRKCACRNWVFEQKICAIGMRVHKIKFIMAKFTVYPYANCMVLVNNENHESVIFPKNERALHNDAWDWYLRNHNFLDYDYEIDDDLWDVELEPTEFEPIPTDFADFLRMHDMEAYNRYFNTKK